MGASTYVTSASAKTAKEAFDALVTEARYMDGNSGYSGTIAEKSHFVMITCPPEVEVRTYINQLFDEEDRRINDKWGPSGCIDAGPDPKDPKSRIFVFFGWASE